MPSWVFYGIFLPWMLVNFLGIWFCFGYMKNDELGDDELDDNELGDNELGDNDRPQDPDKVNS